MTRLAWDEVGARTFEAGLDHGVLYLSDDSGVPWNGLVSVDEKTDDTSTPHYIDGVKFLDAQSLGDFSANLKAFTYPSEFEEYQGLGKSADGLLFGNQPKRRFGLSYRTLLGDDVESTDRGYRIHILYNLTVIAEGKAYASTSEQTEPLTFEWVITGVPVSAPGMRPTVHVIVDSTEVSPEGLSAVEDLLYGTEEDPPALPSIAEILAAL